MNNKKGFSIWELMVVVGVIALISAIAIPGLMKQREKTQNKKKEVEVLKIRYIPKEYKKEAAKFIVDLLKTAKRDYDLDDNIKSATEASMTIFSEYKEFKGSKETYDSKPHEFIDYSEVEDEAK